MIIKKWLPWLLFLIIYILNFWLAIQIPSFPAEEALGVFVVFGISFSFIAYLLVRKEQPVSAPRGSSSGEVLILSLLFILVSISLIYGDQLITAWLPYSIYQSAAVKELITLLRKVNVFVIIPFFCYKLLFKFSWKDFGLVFGLKKKLISRYAIIFSILGLLFILFQWFAGRAAQPIRDGEFAFNQLLIGLPLAYLWLLIEVGLVEEFFFRALLQDRLAVITNSPAWGIVFSSLLFGLAHAPGMYFREAGIHEGLGPDPSFGMAIIYCIAVQATAGLPFAIIWSKTRNLWLVMGLHAAIDLLSNYSGFMKAFW